METVQAVSFHAIAVFSCFQQLHGISLHANKTPGQVLSSAHFIAVTNQAHGELHNYI
jgi:hypothetical protein